MKFLRDPRVIVTAVIVAVSTLFFLVPTTPDGVEIQETYSIKLEEPKVFIGVDGHPPLEVKEAGFIHGVCRVVFRDGSVAEINAGHKVTILRSK